MLVPINSVCSSLQGRDYSSCTYSRRQAGGPHRDNGVSEYRFLLAAFSLAFFSQVRWLPLAFIAVALVGISYALILPAWNAFLAKQVPKGERGTVWGLFLTLQGSGMVAGPVLSGRLWDHVGHGVPFLASAIVMLLLFGLHLLIVHRTKQKFKTS